MSDPWFQSLFADRIGGANYGKGTEIYKFEKIKRAKRAALAAHPERQLLDFGIGENDDMADPLVRDALKREVDKLENRGYADNGIAAFKEAAAGFMKQVFGVTLDPATEINHAIGSKPALAMLPAVLHQPRRRHAHDRARLPRRRHAHRATTAARSTSCRCGRRTASIPTWTASPPTSASGPSCSSSTTPTARPGPSATRDFYRAGHRLRPDQPDRRRAGRGPHPAQLRRPAAELPAGGRGQGGRRRDSLDVEGLQHDRLAHGLRRRPSEDRAGVRRREGQLRLGPVHGRSSRRRPRRCEHPEIGDRIREKYRRRLQKLVAALKQVGFQAKMPGGTYFLYVRAPKAAAAATFANAEEASQFLIHEQSVCCVPWDDAGAVPALLGDVPGEGRGGGGRPDGGDGRAAGRAAAAVRNWFATLRRSVTGSHASAKRRETSARRML